MAGRLRPWRRTRVGMRRRGRGRHGRSGDEDEGVFPPKGSTTDRSPQWGQRTTVVPTRSGFFDLIALEHRLHGNWVTNVSRNWRRRRPRARRRRAGGPDRARGRPGRSPRGPWAPWDSGARRGGPPSDLIVPHRRAGEQLEEDRPETQDVRPDRRVRVSPRPRRAHPDEPLDPGDQLATVLLAETTQFGVDEPGGIGRFEHDPGGGQASVAEALPVGLVDGAGERLDDLGRGHDREGRPSQVIGEGLPLDESRGRGRPRRTVSPASAERRIGGRGIAAADGTSRPLSLGPARGLAVDPPAMASRTDEFRENPHRHRPSPSSNRCPSRCTPRSYHFIAKPTAERTRHA